MKVLELFAGTKSIGKVAKARGHQVFSIDIMPEFDCDLTADILDVTIADLPWVPDVVWASPPCTYFSVASIGKHWNKDNTPKTEQAVQGMRIVMHVTRLIDQLKKFNPKLVFFIENPRGKLRKLNLITKEFLKTVCYCQYGDTRMKPTDIWSNCVSWAARKMCHNFKKDKLTGEIIKHCHHESAPRGARTGTQGLKGNMLRSVIPVQLCEEIIRAAERDYEASKT